MYKLELFKEGKKIRELLFLESEIQLMDAYRQKNYKDGGGSQVWKLVSDDIKVEGGLKK